MQSAGDRLAKGTIVYMIGNMMSKILQMLILPIITASLRTSEYGYYDLIVTTISLVTPVITLQMIEGMFRNMFNSSEQEQRTTVSTVTLFLVIGCVILGGLIAVVYFTVPNVQYPILIYLNYVSAIVFNYTQKLARCQQKNTEFAISGVINTIVMLGCQTVALLVFNMKIDGMLLANCVSYFVASIYLSVHLNIKKLLTLSSISGKEFYSLLKYSAPLIPNSIGWWLISSSDRYVITFFINSAANGVYSIAGKFPQLLTFITSVFQLAWQESAIMEEDSITRDKFYTDTFNVYMKLLMGGYLLILPFIKLIIPILLEESYQIGYIYIPILLVGAIFAAFSQFYGSAYVVFRRTGGAFTTTLVAAIINIIIGIGLVNKLGLFAPAIGTALAFGVQWLVRAHQLRDCFHVTIEKNSLLFLSCCMTIITWLYYINNAVVQIASFVLGSIIFVLKNYMLINKIYVRLTKKRN